MEKISELVKSANNYWAHIPISNKNQKNETLEEHSNLVLNYAESLIEKFGLKSIIKNLIKDSFKIEIPDDMCRQLYNLFCESIYYHDLGKINPNFQLVKMKNPSFALTELVFKSDHSLPGYLLFVQNKVPYSYNIEDEEMSELFLVFLFLLGFQISKHHSPYLDDVLIYFGYKFKETDEEIKHYLNDIRTLFSKLNFTEHPEIGLDAVFEVKNILNDVLVSSSNSFPLFALLKLHYSLLTASDYLATTHYMNKWAELLNNFGTISQELRTRLVKNVRTSKDYNRKVFEKIDGYQFTYPTKPTNENLNKLRQELSIEVIQNIRKNTDKKVFYIEAPTGGGKTNLSMLAAAELLAHNKEINNLYYVFPFTTLITQTYDALQETMGLNEDEIIQVHSKEGFKEKSEGEYGQEKKNHIDYLFLNYPVALLSHVKFFDILKTNGKEKNYLLHRIANSIVVVDELQTYPPKIWDKLIFLIQKYAHYFNIRFILMSATLPKLDKLSHVADGICYLTNHKEKIFQNPNFCNRVAFDFSLLDWEVPDKDEKQEYLYRLASFVLKESENYAFINEKYPNSVFSIIEFIYKQTATEFYSIINELSEGYFDEIFVLSGTILEPRRKEIIHFLKNKNNRNKRVILITTQVVEAGVDIDMDLGFKDKSIVDSDEQLAGRINRNINKPACKLYLFNCDNAEVIYKSDKRFQLLNNDLAGIDREILQNKNFDKLYDEVMKNIDKQNDRTYQVGFNDFNESLKQLSFLDVDKSFQIINQQSSSVFVPMPLPVYVTGMNNTTRNFTEKEMQFLVNHEISNPDDIDISGEKVFELYEQLIEQKNKDFIAAKTELKKLQGIMSKFIFSLMTRSKSMKKLMEELRGEKRLGFYYLSHWKEDEVYNYYFGLVEKNEPAIIL